MYRVAFGMLMGVMAILLIAEHYAPGTSSRIFDMEKKLFGGEPSSTQNSVIRTAGAAIEGDAPDSSKSSPQPAQLLVQEKQQTPPDLPKPERTETKPPRKVDVPVSPPPGPKPPDSPVAARACIPPLNAEKVPCRFVVKDAGLRFLPMENIIPFSKEDFVYEDVSVGAVIEVRQADRGSEDVIVDILGEPKRHGLINREQANLAMQRTAQTGATDSPFNGGLQPTDKPQAAPIAAPACIAPIETTSKLPCTIVIRDNGMYFAPSLDRRRLEEVPVGTVLEIDAVVKPDASSKQWAGGTLSGSTKRYGYISLDQANSAAKKSMTEGSPSNGQIQGDAPAPTPAILRSSRWRSCESEEATRLDQQLVDCTAIIKSGFEGVSNLSKAYNNRGITYAHLGKFDLAIQDYNEAIRLSPNEAGTYSNRAVSYTNLGQYDLALRDYDQAIKLDQSKPRFFKNRGVVYGRVGKHDLALKDFSQAILLNPSDPESFLFRADSYDDLQQYQLAIKDYSEAVRLNPKYATAFHNRGVCYGHQNMRDLEIKDYHQAILLDRSKPEFFKSRGVAYSRMNKPDLAVQDYNQAILLRPDDPELFSYRGDSYVDLKQYSLAIRDYSEAIRLSPKDATLYRLRGSAYNRTEQYDLAVQDYSHAILLSPGSARLFLYRAESYDSLHQWKLAIEDYNEAIRLNPKYAIAYYNRGLDKQELGDEDGGEADIEVAKRLDPNVSQ